MREIPLHTLSGVKDVDVTTHYVTTADGVGISLLRFQRGACDDAVVIAHGLTTSTDMFIMPEHYNLVSFLLDRGLTDVWCLDFRMSNRHPYNLTRHRWTIDDCAVYDFPAAIAAVRKVIGDRRIHVVSHCLGAMSFAMSLFGRTVTGIRSAIANSVALTPRVPGWSRLKIAIAPFAVDYLLNAPYLNPLWREEAGLTLGKAVATVVSLFHQECKVPACHMLSLMWGTGWPALYEHRNLADVTHRRGGDLYGATSMNYYRHVSRMLRSGGRTVKYAPDDPRYAALPDDYIAGAREVETPCLFMTGRHNRVFADSNIACHAELEKVVPGRHRLQVFDGYGHQDPFMGKDNHVDVFPALAEFIERNRTGYGAPR